MHSIAYAHIFSFFGSSADIQALHDTIAWRVGDGETCISYKSTAITLSAHERFALAGDRPGLVAAARARLGRPRPFPLSIGEVVRGMDQEQRPPHTPPDDHPTVSLHRLQAVLTGEEDAVLGPMDHNNRDAELSLMIDREHPHAYTCKIQHLPGGIGLLVITSPWQQDTNPLSCPMFYDYNPNRLPGLTLIETYLDNEDHIPTVHITHPDGRVASIAPPRRRTHLHLRKAMLAQGLSTTLYDAWNGRGEVADRRADRIQARQDRRHRSAQRR